MRILGITIPDNKKVKVALTAVYGIGLSRALYILKEAKVDPEKRVTELNANDENAIRKVVEEFKLEGDLKREVSSNIKRLREIKSYKGVRHIRGLPVNGQRTKTNSRTRRGNVRKTMGTGRRAVDKK